MHILHASLPETGVWGLNVAFAL